MSDSRHDQPHDPQPREPADLGELYVRYATKLCRVVGSRVNTSDANLDDACGYAWTQLIATRPRHDAIFAWLVTVATREAWRLDRLARRAAGTADDLAAEAVEDPAAQAQPEDRLDLDEVLDILRTIHPRKRRMLALHATGHTYAEIARHYGISAARARELVYRARLQLRDRVDRAAGGGGTKPRRR